MTAPVKRPIRIAVLTTLFPNREYPRHGIFVAERLRCLVASGEVEARVVAPVPWFFSRHPVFGRYARFASVPRRETYQGIPVDHPRYLVVPRIGMTLAPSTLARAAGHALARLRNDGFDFDLIDAHYFYPDGVAAARVAARFDRPFTVTARGADLNTIAQMPGPGRRIRAAAARADGLITVSNSLADRLVALGVERERINTLRNGVDLARFKPLAPDAARAALGLSGRVWLCVGHLIERKGMHIVIEALASVPDVTLVIAGDGPEEGNLRVRARRLGVTERVRFAGAVAHDDLVEYYNAADALMLPARSEGMPNVVLEALACGTAVIATAVDGIPEVMAGPPAGRLMAARTPEALVAAWCEMESNELVAAARANRRAYAEQFSWDATTAGQLALFERIIAARAAFGGSRYRGPDIKRARG